MRSLIDALVADQDGGSLVEYILLISLVALICAAGISLIGNNVKPGFETVSNALK